MHLVKSWDGDYFEFDDKFTGTITLTYTVKADNVADANECLRYVAERLTDTGVIGVGMSTADARLKRSKANRILKGK